MINGKWFMIGVLLPIYLSWADSLYVGGLKCYQTMGKLVLAMEMRACLYMFSLIRMILIVGELI